MLIYFFANVSHDPVFDMYTFNFNHLSCIVSFMRRMEYYYIHNVNIE